jgi:NADPH:quinone reductase
MKAAMMVPGPQGGAWEVRDIQRPVVGPGQVLVGVRASSINRAEFRRLHGMKSGEARTGGGDAAGEVVAIGVDVTGIKEGDRIMARCAGGFAECAGRRARGDAGAGGFELGRGGVGAGGVCRRA